MKNKLLVGIISVIALIALVSAAIYTEPWNVNQRGGNHNLTEMDWISANVFNGSFRGNISGNIAWSNLTDYPVACPGSSAVTTLNDSVYCSDLWFDVAGNETITGNMTFSNSGILNLSLIESLDWSNVTITESQISNLIHTINGTNTDILDINASSATFHGDVNMSGGNLTLMDKITFRFREVIDNILDGWISITGGLNVAGAINMSGDLNQTNGNATINMIYGEMWSHNDTGTMNTSIGSQHAWYNVSGFNSTAIGEIDQRLNGFIFNDSAEHLTASVAGLYRVSYSVSFGNAGNNEEYQFVIAVNEVHQNNTDTHRKIGAGGDVGVSSTTGFIDLSVGDNVHLMVTDRTGTADLLAHAMNVNLFRIGD